jgi:hypothetical protein
MAWFGRCAGDHTPQQKGRRVKATFYARLMGVATISKDKDLS